MNFIRLTTQNNTYFYINFDNVICFTSNDSGSSISYLEQGEYADIKVRETPEEISNYILDKERKNNNIVCQIPKPILL